MTRGHAKPIPPLAGELRWSPFKTLWWLVPTLAFAAWGPFTVSPTTIALLLFLLLVIVGLGHVVGVHRGLIHRSYHTFPWLERSLVWLGSLAGMTRLFGLIYQHDIRDHWQNQKQAPAVYAYAHPLITDFIWYLHATWTPSVQASKATRFEPPLRPGVHDDAFFRWLDASWLWQQVGLGLVLFAIGGWDFVVWGVFGRLSITITLFWLVNYLAHTSGELEQSIHGSGEMGRNNWLLGVVSFGEGWHNNHHAWPSSAKNGRRWHEFDGGYAMIRLFEVFGLFWDVQTTAVKRQE